MAAIREVLDVANTYPEEHPERHNLILEATRMGLRLLELIKQIEEQDLD